MSSRRTCPRAVPLTPSARLGGRTMRSVASRSTRPRPLNSNPFETAVNAKSMLPSLGRNWPCSCPVRPLARSRVWSSQSVPCGKPHYALRVQIAQKCHRIADFRCVRTDVVSLTGHAPPLPPILPAPSSLRPVMVKPPCLSSRSVTRKSRPAVANGPDRRAFRAASRPERAGGDARKIGRLRIDQQIVVAGLGEIDTAFSREA